MDKEARLEYFRYGYEEGFKEAYRIIMSDIEKAVKVSLPRKMKEYEDIQITKGGKTY